MKRKSATSRTGTSNNSTILGREEWINTKTGEITETVTTSIETTDINFAKVWITHLLTSLEVVGGSKMKVVNYILDKMNYTDNTLISTYEEISSKTGISERTVGETIRILRDTNFLTTRPGVIMLNPDIIAKGGSKKRQSLLIKFGEFGNESK